MKTLKKWLIQLRNWVAELINYYITEPACDYYKRRLRWILHIVALSLVTLALAYLSAYNVLTQWFVKQQVITLAPWTYVRTAKAAEMTTEQYIRLVFGKEAPIALAVAKAESGMRCDAQNVNKGTNSLDAGLFQINSVHLKKGWKIADLLDCRKNTDYAKQIRDGSGWCAWVTYQKMNPNKCK